MLVPEFMNSSTFSLLKGFLGSFSSLKWRVQERRMSHSVQIVKHTEALGYVILDYINTIDLTFDFMHHLKFVNVSYHPKHLSGGSQLLYCQMELISLATECHSSTVSPSLLVHPLNKASCPAWYWVSEWWTFVSLLSGWTEEKETYSSACHCQLWVGCQGWGCSRAC